MNKYEVMVIVKPAEEEATNAVIEKVEALIARVGGTVEKVDRWGKRRLAYAVKKFTDGFYVLINFEAAPAEIKEIDRVLKINDDIIPLPYCMAPNSAAPDPAILPALSKANALVTAAMIPFMEKNRKQPITINHNEW